MEDTELFFSGKKPNPEKLAAFGFARENGIFIYRAPLPGTRLEIQVTVTPQGGASATVTDTQTNAPYTLHLTGGEGKFVGSVRTGYEALLYQIADECFDKDVFKTSQAQEILAHALKVYGNEPEYLWKQYPDYAVLRRTNSGKWYAIVMRVLPTKLGLPEGAEIEILDLRVRPEEMAELVDGTHYFPGYHMNKKHWITVCLDGRLPTEEILRRLDESYLLAAK